MYALWYSLDVIEREREREREKVTSTRLNMLSVSGLMDLKRPSLSSRNLDLLAGGKWG